MIKGKLHVKFAPQQLTSYSGLEVLRRYLRQHDLPRRLRSACRPTGGDYGGGRLALLVLALFYVGARRLEHLRYVAGDPLIARFCGLARLPTTRTLGNWLRQFTQATLAPLVQLNHDLVVEAVQRLAVMVPPPPPPPAPDFVVLPGAPSAPLVGDAPPVYCNSG